MERRVVVTGMGAVSPLGLDVPTLWQAVQESRSGVPMAWRGRVRFPDAPSSAKISQARRMLRLLIIHHFN